MTWRLFLDDERNPITTVDSQRWRRRSRYLPDVPAVASDHLGPWRIARSSEKAILMIENFGCPSYVSFDHDLSGDDTAMIVVRYLIDLDLDTGALPRDFAYEVHSANPVGRTNVDELMKGWLREKAARF